jgi:hypothetical protein
MVVLVEALECEFVLLEKCWAYERELNPRLKVYVSVSFGLASWKLTASLLW